MKQTNTNQDQLNNFVIYRDGELDRKYLLKRRTKRFLRLSGQYAYKALETTLETLDEAMAR